MIDIDDIYEACRAVSSYDQLRFRINMLMWRESLRGRIIVIDGLAMNGSAWLAVASNPRIQKAVDAVNRLNITLQLDTTEVREAFAKLNAVAAEPRHVKWLESTDKVRIKAQWKHEARMRHGRNWKR